LAAAHSSTMPTAVAEVIVQLGISRVCVRPPACQNNATVRVCVRLRGEDFIMSSVSPSGTALPAGRA